MSCVDHLQRFGNGLGFERRCVFTVTVFRPGFAEVRVGLHLVLGAIGHHLLSRCGQRLVVESKTVNAFVAIVAFSAAARANTNCD